MTQVQRIKFASTQHIRLCVTHCNSEINNDQGRHNEAILIIFGLLKHLSSSITIYVQILMMMSTLGEMGIKV